MNFKKTKKTNKTNTFPLFLYIAFIQHLHSTILRRSRTAFLENLESKCLYIPVNLRSKISGGGGEGVEKFLSVRWLFGTSKILKFFILIEILGNSSIF